MKLPFWGQKKDPLQALIVRDYEGPTCAEVTQAGYGQLPPKRGFVVTTRRGKAYYRVATNAAPHGKFEKLCDAGYHPGRQPITENGRRVEFCIHCGIGIDAEGFFDRSAVNFGRRIEMS